MKIYTQLKDFVLPIEKKTVLAIGNFDGIHSGHQKILQTLVQKAKELELPAGVLTFKTHPKTFLYGKKIECLSTPEQRLSYFESQGIDFCLILEESKSFFEKTPDQFIREVLCDLFRVRAVVVGENFRFGFQAQGTVAYLEKMKEFFDFEVQVISMVKNRSEVVSSSRIRKSVENLDFEDANFLLNRTDFFTGVVVRGNQRGTALGFPTANLKLPQEQKIANGVYAVRCWIGEERFQGVLNVGTSPTFGGNELRCEIHVLHFEKRDLYGETLTFQILQKIRDEKKFSSQEALIQQIQQDISSSSISS
jgi:riboflavin kinase/FMN adenylyltransferase